MPETCLVYVTTPSPEIADRLAEAAVAERLAACANVLAGHRSVYRWQGEIERADETALLLKTARDRLDALTARIRELHPYDEPCVIALPIVGGSASFLGWIEAETRAS